MHIRSLLRNVFAAALLATSLGVTTSAFPPEENQQTGKGNDLSGLHAFDSHVGCWVFHNRVLRERLAHSQDWFEYDANQRFWLVMGGYGNMDENWLNKPEGAYHGLTVRTYDPKTAVWTIWWFDGRNPSDDIDPPVRGHFVNGVGTFLGDITFNGKPTKTRYIWSKMTDTSAHWEQAFSADGGKTWETNWYADFKRVNCSAK